MIHVLCATCRCGNVAAIFELDEHLRKNYAIFEAAPSVSSCVTALLPVAFECCLFSCRKCEVNLPENQSQNIFFEFYFVSIVHTFYLFNYRADYFNNNYAVFINLSVHHSIDVILHA